MPDGIEDLVVNNINLSETYTNYDYTFTFINGDGEVDDIDPKTFL